MVNQLFGELANLEQVEAIALGGSRAGEFYDKKSDYDVYVYITSPISEETRRGILEKYCGYMEIGNQYWELEDNCVLKNNIDIDILYRDLDTFCEGVADVAEKFRAHNGYTTCNDKNGRLKKAKERFDIPYPDQLRDNIIKRNTNLLYAAMPAYSLQIKKACARNDRVSIVHRTAAFLESYFDVLFALNRQTHPGEKRLIELCRKTCALLPNNFEENLDRLFHDMAGNGDRIPDDIDEIINELKKMGF